MTILRETFYRRSLLKDVHTIFSLSVPVLAQAFIFCYYKPSRVLF
jgi:hypothetical protein